LKKGGRHKTPQNTLTIASFGKKVKRIVFFVFLQSCNFCRMFSQNKMKFVEKRPSHLFTFARFPLTPLHQTKTMVPEFDDLGEIR
jgi:hypothetical protein